MADLAVPADLIATVTMEGAEIAGRPVVEVFPVVVVRLAVEVTARTRTGLETDIPTTTEDLALAALAEGDRVVRLVSQVAGAEEEEAPPAKATMADDEAVEDAPT